MADSIETSEREAEDPREPIRLPVRNMRDEPVPAVAALEQREPVAFLATAPGVDPCAFVKDDPDLELAKQYPLVKLEPLYTSPPTSADAVDAERYRWLRDRHWVEPEATFRLGLTETDNALEYHRQLDAAIDAAIAATKEKA